MKYTVSSAGYRYTCRADSPEIAVACALRSGKFKRLGMVIQVHQVGKTELDDWFVSSDYACKTHGVWIDT